jgi:hypothetical protein
MQHPTTTRTQKTLSDVYDILRVSRSMSTVNTHPLSSMLTRNLRIFENIKWQLSKSVTREINANEKFVID